jgi:hypothetical protein
MSPPYTTLALLAVAAGCGPTVVRTYPGPELGPGQTSSLWSNEQISMSVDDRYGVPTSEVAVRRRFEMTPGHHVVKLSCVFTDDVQYTRVGGPPGPPGATPAVAPIVDRSLGGQGEPVLRSAGGPTQSSAAITGSPPPRSTSERTIETIRSSRPRFFALDAVAGHSYLPRAHFTRDDSGKPACDLRIDDITGEKNGEKAQTY